MTADGQTARASDLTPSDLAPGLLLGPDVELGREVMIGGNVVIHRQSRISPGATIQDGAVIGKPAVLGPASSAERSAPAAAEIGAGAAVLAGAIVFGGARIEPGAIVGDQASVRERSVVGRDSVVGRGSAVDNDVVIGSRVRIQTGCYVTAYSEIEDDVFVGPCVVTTNDNSMGRHSPDAGLEGVTLRRACRIGGGAVLCPGVEIGEEAFVAAGSVVTRSVPARSVVMGVPATVVRSVGDDDVLERWT